MLPGSDDAMIVAFRRYTLLPLDDCLYALQQSIPLLTRSALDGCLRRHCISRLPIIEGDKPKRQKLMFNQGFCSQPDEHRGSQHLLEQSKFNALNALVKGKRKIDLRLIYVAVPGFGGNHAKPYRSARENRRTSARNQEHEICSGRTNTPANLDIGTRSIHSRSDPPDAGTEHLEYPMGWAFDLWLLYMPLVELNSISNVVAT